MSSMVSRRPEAFSEAGSFGSPMNQRNDAFWMSIRLGTSRTFSSLEKVLRTRGEVVSGNAKPPGRARRGNQAGRIRTKGATENPSRLQLPAQTGVAGPARGMGVRAPGAANHYTAGRLVVKSR